MHLHIRPTYGLGLRGAEVPDSPDIWVGFGGSDWVAFSSQGDDQVVRLDVWGGFASPVVDALTKHTLPTRFQTHLKVG